MAAEVVERIASHTPYSWMPDETEWLRGEIFDLCRTIRADQAVKTKRLHDHD